MIRNIIKDISFLSQKSTDMTVEDKNVIQDLKDTLNFNRVRCVGMAANMVGHLKNCIIFVNNANELVIMNNPIILAKSIPYEVEEGCLSLDGVRKTTRYKKIKVKYFDENFKIKIKTYLDYEAQIIQHEIDHLFGIII